MTTTKTFCFVIALVAVCAAGSQAQVSPSTNPGAEARDYSVTERGDHHREWKRVEYEMTPDKKQVPRVHSCDELETRIHHFEEGEWKGTQKLIETCPSGADAQHGPRGHSALFGNR